MKRRLFLILFLFLLPFLSFSQIIKEVGDFKKVSAFDKITVFLIPADENKVEISGFNADKVELIIVNEELQIKLPVEKGFDGNEILAKVYFVNIRAVEANDQCNIGASTSIKVPFFEIISKNNSIIKLDVIATKVIARIYQGSTLDLLGNIDNIDVTASNNSKINAKNCQVKNASVYANSGGEIVVNASQSVDAKVRVGGTIQIVGKPKHINQQTILGGDIIVSTN